MGRHRSLNDILAGLIFIGIGLAFGIASTGYELGTALRMGPGYFPLVLAGIMCALGLAIIVKGLLATTPDEPLGVWPWRGLILLPAAFVVFGLTVRGLGLVPSLFVTAVLAAMASRHNTLVGSLVLAAALTVFCVPIFSYGLGVPIALFGPWTSF